MTNNISDKLNILSADGTSPASSEVTILSSDGNTPATAEILLPDGTPAAGKSTDEIIVPNDDFIV